MLASCRDIWSLVDKSRRLPSSSKHPHQHNRALSDEHVQKGHIAVPRVLASAQATPHSIVMGGRGASFSPHPEPRHPSHEARPLKHVLKCGEGQLASQ